MQQHQERIGILSEYTHLIDHITKEQGWPRAVQELYLYGQLFSKQ